MKLIKKTFKTNNQQDFQKSNTPTGIGHFANIGNFDFLFDKIYEKLNE